MISKRSLEVLLDLAENKLSDIAPFDRDDVREIKMLHACVNELRALRGLPPIELPGRENAPRPNIRAVPRLYAVSAYETELGY